MACERLQQSRCVAGLPDVGQLLAVEHDLKEDPGAVVACVCLLNELVQEIKTYILQLEHLQIGYSIIIHLVLVPQV